jgi:hypothetical protein
LLRHQEGWREVYGYRRAAAGVLLVARSGQRRQAQARGLQGREGPGGSELADLKKQARELAVGVLGGEVETGKAAVTNQIYNTLIRAIEQERKNLETGELAERLEAMEEVLKGRKTG